MLEITATCLVITALLAYLNFRYIGLPITIGVMATSLGLSLLLVGLHLIGVDFGLHLKMEAMLKEIDFSNVLMQGMLSLLLFAGALILIYPNSKPTAGKCSDWHFFRHCYPPLLWVLLPGWCYH